MVGRQFQYVEAKSLGNRVPASDALLNGLIYQRGEVAQRIRGRKSADVQFATAKWAQTTAAFAVDRNSFDHDIQSAG
jgi:hypothetical protein